tara:strand:- start:751 stop:1497 length:747 start_codon:yes stop_codon:yes gene_type:complete
MSYHIINIDSPNCYIGCKNRQLICRNDGSEKRIPLEDVASIIITSFSATLHSELLIEAANNGVSLILCRDFMPISILMPANRSSDTLLTKAALTLPKKTVTGLWRKTLDAKCINQYLLGDYLVPDHPKLEALSYLTKRKSLSKESAASRYYWRIFSDSINNPEFKREPSGGGVNKLLNYGYAVLLSTVLQKLFALGLDPTLGIHHEVRERSAPLAYDLMEPFRPCVDFQVIKWLRKRENPDDKNISKE